MEVILEEITPPDADDLVAEVTCDKPTLLNPGAEDGEGLPLPRLAAIDCGVKHNILRELCTRFEVVWCPADMPLEEISRDWSPDALFASNGPGDPEPVDYAVENIKALIGKVPIFGICLGHQILGLAIGAKSYKLKFGHRGGNHPVQDLATQKVEITSHNHGFSIDAASLPEDIAEMPHINLNDKTLEGFRLKHQPAFSVQYHPEASPGPHDANYLFKRFVDMMEQWKRAE